MSRTGKIRQLPRDIRDALNQRLQNGETGDTLLPWLNGLPEVQSVLARHFAGALVTKQNLSEWRSRGFAEWQARQEMLADARELAADSAELATLTEGRLADHLATVLTARYASALADWNGEVTEEFQQKIKLLRGMCQDTAAMRWGDYSSARLQMERERLTDGREKTEDAVLAQFKTWAAQPSVKDWLCQDWISPQERNRRLREIFGQPPEPDPVAPASVIEPSSPVPPPPARPGQG